MESTDFGWQNTGENYWDSKMVFDEETGEVRTLSVYREMLTKETWAAQKEGKGAVWGKKWFFEMSFDNHVGGPFTSRTAAIRAAEKYFLKTRPRP